MGVELVEVVRVVPVAGAALEYWGEVEDSHAEVFEVVEFFGYTFHVAAEVLMTAVHEGFIRGFFVPL